MNTTTLNETPAAWIGCLSCYNSGKLRGKWITAEQAAEEMTAENITYGNQAETVTVGTYTAPRCKKCFGDEFDLFDTEHLPARTTVREFYENAEQLAELDNTGDLARIIVLSHWLLMENLDELIAYDNNNYRGEWNTFQDYAENLLEDTGDLETIPEHLRTYFDYESFSRDLAHDYYHDTTTGHTWISR